MRRTPFGSRLSATAALLIINVIAFVAQNVLYRFSRFPVDPYFALSIEGLKHGYVWQLLTYQFMHGGILHLLVNCWAIYMFGRELEETLGRKSFLTLYFASGVIGGLVQALAGVLLDSHFALPVVGASAGAFGLIAGFAALFPERPLTMLLFFIIPINMRAKFLLLIEALLAIFGILFPGDNIAHAAHLGGMLTGLAFVRYAIHWRWHWPQLRGPGRGAPQRLIKVHSQKASLWGGVKPAVEEDLPPEEFLSREVDPILDKISAHGIQSLTERERRILEAARTRMARR